MTEIYSIVSGKPAKPMTREETIAALRRARAKYQGKVDKQTLEQFERMARINTLLVRSTKIRLRAVASGDRRQHKRADRQFAQAMIAWHLQTRSTFASIGQALNDIAAASRQALLAIRMMGEGVQITFKPKGPAE